MSHWTEHRVTACDVVGLGAGVIAVGLLSPLLAFFGALGAVGLIIGLQVVQDGAQKRERARLLDDCHAQHQALLQGGPGDTLAYFGRHLPTPINSSYAWCAPPEAYPATSRVA